MLTLQASKTGGLGPTVLSERLSAIAESLPRGGVMCDVGSDHGALPLFLLEKRYCRRALVTDLNAMPLKRAENVLSAAGLSQQCEFFLTDGIAELLPRMVDSYVIAGMGGETIAGILERAGSAIPKGTFFALQPMTRVHLLRKFLYENGFLVEGEQAVAENGKVFLILFARYDGVSRFREDLFYFLGEFLPKLKTDAAKLYFHHLLLQIRSKIDGKKKAGKCISDEKKEELLLLAALEEFQ